MEFAINLGIFAVIAVGMFFLLEWLTHGEEVSRA
jgi:hypothetical protein